MEAALAYDESLAAVQYINETYGMSDLQTHPPASWRGQFD